MRHELFIAPDGKLTLNTISDIHNRHMAFDLELTAGSAANGIKSIMLFTENALNRKIEHDTKTKETKSA